MSILLDKFELFIEAIKIGSQESFKKYFKVEFLETKVENVRYPIHLACLLGHTEIVKLLLDRNCNIEARDNWNNSSIHLACRKCHIEIVKLLLDYNCNIEVLEKGKLRPIHIACKTGQVEIVKLLIDHNCDIEVSNKWIGRPIHIAVNRGHIKIVKLLIDSNCDIDAYDKNFNRPIHLACKTSQVEIMKLLIGHNCDINACDKWNLRPIHLACKTSQVEILKLLIGNNCDINACDKWNLRPIHFACEVGHSEIVELLINGCCDIEACDVGNYRPIHVACEEGHIELVKLLNFHKCDFKARDKRFRTSVHIACRSGHKEIVKLLIDYKCDIEARDDRGLRPIHWACKKGNVEIVKLLIENNCKIHAKDYSQLTSIDIAEKLNNKELIEILVANNVKLDPNLVQLISKMGLECKPPCDHKLCPKSLKDLNFDKGTNIGSGGFGQVYRIQGSEIDKKFALKKIKLQLCDAKCIEGNINKFIPELNHVRIVQYFGAIETEKNLLIFMEFLPGGSLQNKIIEEKVVSNEDIIQYSKQILEGLEFLHEKKIIHRDLKPANILIDLVNNIKLADFGLGRLLMRTGGVSTYAHTFTGTLSFMAPEIISENESYTVSADIWSLGATVINMVTGKPPFHDYEPVALIFKLGLSKELELPESLNISDEMINFIKNMINSDPKKRPTATELLKSNLFS